MLCVQYDDPKMGQRQALLDQGNMIVGLRIFLLFRSCDGYISFRVDQERCGRGFTVAVLENN